VIRYVLFTSGLEVEFSIAEFQIITHAPQQQPTIQHEKFLPYLRCSPSGPEYFFAKEGEKRLT
jgi:hypothetical protein